MMMMMMMLMMRIMMTTLLLNAVDANVLRASKHFNRNWHLLYKKRKKKKSQHDDMNMTRHDTRPSGNQNTKIMTNFMRDTRPNIYH